MTTVAILGFGRFGQAIGSLFAHHNIDFRALDSKVEIPRQYTAGSLEDLVSGARFVLVAVPVPQLSSALTSLKPFLTPSQIVLDVGSVKQKPALVFDQVLGSAIPWVCTHPLFGPHSLSMSDRRLKTVVCPSDRHPQATQEVSALYRRIGSEVILQSPDEHDRVMAFTQALTYFVAEGVGQVCAGVELPFVPPSFLSLSSLVDVVRSDGPLLFDVIERQNPHAGPVRKALIDVLTKLAQTLDRSFP